MGDQNTILDTASARHLLRRTCFGATGNEIAGFTGMTRGAAADLLLGFTPANFQPGGRYVDSRHNSWLRYMLKIKSPLNSGGRQSPLQEKLVLFWHDHFATSADKVGDARFMGKQNKLLRQHCKGDFKQLMKDINRDVAMIEFLDTVRNKAQVPNENYGRELLELFTLGVYDFAGNDNYLQEDIVQIARAFTGWGYDYNRAKAEFADYDHDYLADWPDRGPKTIFKVKGGFGASGRTYAGGSSGLPEGETEIDQVIDVILQHRDGEGKNTVARRLARRLLEYFAHGGFAASTPAVKAVVDTVVTQSGFATNWDIGALVRAILVNDASFETSSPAPFGPATKKSVKWPIDYAVSTMRLLGVKPKSRYAYIAGGSYASLRDQLGNMGQLLFQPPSVFGWDWETAWINSATLLARYNFARDITTARGQGPTAFRSDRLIDLGLTDPAQILDAVTEVLGVTDQLSAAEKADLIDYLTDNGQNPTLDLRDYGVRNSKLNGLFALVLQSPAYQLH